VILASVPMILTAGPAVAESFPSVGEEILDVAIPIAKCYSVLREGVPSFQVKTTVAASSTPVSLSRTKLPVT
jgi:hypothetical protein